MADQGENDSGAHGEKERPLESSPSSGTDEHDGRTNRLPAIDAATQPSRELPRMANSLSDRLRRRLGVEDDETSKALNVSEALGAAEEDTRRELDVRAIIGGTESDETHQELNVAQTLSADDDEEPTNKRLDVAATLAADDETTNKRLNVAETLGSDEEEPTNRVLNVAAVLADGDEPTHQRLDPSDAIAASDLTHRQLDVADVVGEGERQTAPYGSVDADHATTRHPRTPALDRVELFADEVIKVTDASGRHPLAGESAEDRLEHAIRRVHVGRHGGSDDKTLGLVIVESDLFRPLPEDVYAAPEDDGDDSTLFFADEILRETEPIPPVSADDGEERLAPDERLDVAIRRLHISRHGGTDQGTLRLTAVQPEDVLTAAELATPLRVGVTVAGTLAASLLIAFATVATTINLWWETRDALVCYFAIWGLPVSIGWLVLQRKSPLRAIPPILAAVAVGLPFLAWDSEDVRMGVLEFSAAELSEAHARRVLLDPSDAVALKVCEMVGGAGRLEKLAANDLAQAPSFAVRCLERVPDADERRDLTALVSGFWRESILVAGSCEAVDETIAAYAEIAASAGTEGTRKLVSAALEANSAEVRACLAADAAARSEGSLVAALGDPALRTVYDKSLFRNGIRFAFAPSGDAVATTLATRGDPFRVWVVRVGCRLTLDRPEDFEIVSDLNSMGSAMAETEVMGASRSTWLGWCADIGPNTTTADMIQMVHGVRVDEAMRLARTAVLRARHAYSRRGTPEAIHKGARMAGSEGHKLFGSGILTKRPGGDLVNPALNDLVWQFDSEVQVNAQGTQDLWDAMKDQPGDETQLLCERGRDTLLGGTRLDFVVRYQGVDPDGAATLAADARSRRESVDETERTAMRKAIESDCGKGFLDAVDEEISALDALAPVAPEEGATSEKKTKKRGKKRGR